MLRKLQKHLSFANVTSLMALIVATSGVAWAATTLPNNSVGAPQIKKNGVGASEIAKDAVSRSEVKKSAVAADELKDGSIAGIEVTDGALAGADIGDGTVALADLAANSVDSSKAVDESLTGTDIANGSLGGNEVAAGTFLGGKITVQRTDIALPAGAGAGTPGAEVDAFATCAAGQQIIAGSVNVSSTTQAEVLISRPATTNVGNGGIPNDGDAFPFWKGTARTLTNVAHTMRVFAICTQLP